MNTTKIMIAASLVLVAFAGTASAHTWTPASQGAQSAGTLDITGLGVLGVAVCQDLDLPVLLCGTNGLGAFFDATPLEQGDRHSHASGTCNVELGGQQLNGVEYFYSCGTDRNDDNFVTDNEVCTGEDDTSTAGRTPAVTNHDECSGETAVASTLGPGTFDGVNEHHADDWVDGCWSATVNAGCPTGVRAKTQSFCFQDDVRGWTNDPSDDTGAAGDDVGALNQAVFDATGAPGAVPATNGWDDIVVFVGIQVGQNALGPHVGTVTITLTGNGTNNCGVVSGEHTTVGNTRTV